MSTKDLFLEHIVPIVGGVIAVCMFGSPVIAVFRARKMQSLGELNPIPFPVIAANCIAWTGYSCVVNLPYLYVPNAIGFLCGMFMTSICIGFAPLKVKDVLVAIECCTAVLMLVLGAVSTLCDIHKDVLKPMWGFTANAILFGYYFSPLIVVRKVVATKDSSAFYWPFCVMNCINASLWFTFGLARQDYFIAAPNGTGLLLAIISVVLCIMYPRVAERQALEDLAAQSAAAVGAEEGKQAAQNGESPDIEGSPDNLIRCS